MKSAIFDTDPLGGRRARKPAPNRNAISNRPNLKSSNRRAQSASPYPLSTTTFNKQGDTNTAKRKSSLPPKPQISVSWNLQEMLSIYSDKGILPTPLSPSIPASFKDKTVKDEKHHEDSDIDENISLSMLSPTLPSMFELKPNIEETFKPQESTYTKQMENEDNAQVNNTKKDLSKGKGLTPKPANSLQSENTRQLQIEKPSLVQVARKNIGFPNAKMMIHINLPSSSSSSSSSSSAPIPAVNKNKSVKSKPLTGLGLDLGSKPSEAGLSSEKNPNTNITDRLLQQKTHYTTTAREVRQQAIELESDKPILSLIMKFDSILCAMISCDLDERHKVATELLPSERNWNLILEECNGLIKFISTITDFGPYMSNFTGVLHFTRAILAKRINQVLNRAIESYKKKQARPNQKVEVQLELANKIIDLQSLQTNNFSLMSKEFLEAQAKIVMFGKYFPKTYSRKATEPMTESEQDGLQPATDPFFLPIGIYSQLQEVSGFMYGCVREFVESERLYYTMRSGK